MDYLKTYNSYYDKEEKKIEEEIRGILIKSSDNQRNFTLVLNKINNDYLLVQKKLNLELLNSNNKESYDYFITRYDLYQGDNVDNLILINECFEAFENSNKHIETPIPYDEFIKEVAIYESTVKTRYRFNNYKNLYELMYNLKDFKNFSLKEVEKGYRSCGLYDRLFKKCYPDYVPDLGYIDASINVVEDSNNLTDKEKDLNYRINIFSEDEKLLLMYIYFNKPKIPKTELLKASRLAQIDDTSLFNKDTSNNTTYNKFVKGLDYYDNVKTKRDLIDALIDNIKGFGLNKITEYLRIERRKIR